MSETRKSLENNDEDMDSTIEDIDQTKKEEFLGNYVKNKDPDAFIEENKQKPLKFNNDALEEAILRDA